MGLVGMDWEIGTGELERASYSNQINQLTIILFKIWAYVFVSFVWLCFFLSLFLLARERDTHGIKNAK
jgi:hypothetical protein